LFSNTIIYSWIGTGYEMSSYILKVLLLGQLINILFSVPGNSITPNIGIPKFQMYEGLISLVLNLIVTFLLIKYYGIIGAAWGNTISASISSFYIFYVSLKVFRYNNGIKFIKDTLMIPTVSTVIFGLFFYLIYFFIIKYYLVNFGRVVNLLFILIYFLIFFILSLLSFKLIGYFKERDLLVFKRILTMTKIVNKS
jgi:O-antigen/teichoic acid export membrane protein